MQHNSYMGRGQKNSSNKVKHVLSRRSPRNGFTAELSAHYCHLYGAPRQEANRLVFIDEDNGRSYKIPLNRTGQRENLREANDAHHAIIEEAQQKILLSIGKKRQIKPSTSWQEIIAELKSADVQFV